MPFKIYSLTKPLCYFLLNLILLTLIHSLDIPDLPDDVAVNCGSSGNSNQKLGRQWTGDIGSKFILTSQGSKVKSVKSIAIEPYTTARISSKQFSYVFHVSPGQKFVRLYFYPNSYPGFSRSNDFFTVKSGPYTLLSNFSASLNADAFGVSYLVKEFCVNVDENQPLTIAFSPSHEAYAFVNGIEIVSMPPGLYFTTAGEEGMRVLGKTYKLSIDKSTALEMVHRLNVGGSSISSLDDNGLFREWSDDSNFFTRSDVQPVDLGFRYLVRLHFCDLDHEIEESNEVKFSVYINDQLAEANANVNKWSGGSGVAVFRDYVVIMEGDRMEGKRDLLISLCSKMSNDDKLWTKNTDTVLKGLEVFKLSNTDNNLAGVNPMPLSVSSKNSMLNPYKFVYANGGNFIAAIMTVLISIASIIVYQLRILGEQYVDSNNNNISQSPSEGKSRHFSLVEVRSATNNFDNLLVIGKGGFGLVYKGVIDGVIDVAIKRLNAKSKQGAEEFWTEIDTLSKLRHRHLVSLIGYCDEGGEMILVYDYMEHGTLADHLYKNKREGGSVLSWEQKLNICIGAARGLDYLHTGTQHGVIHRDVKTTNILLDSEWLAKIADFGLCKIGTTNHTHISTNVKGTFGYFDPEYFYTRRLTKKSDVWAFGVVMLEVLCGRPPVDMTLSEDRRSLAQWGPLCIKEGKLDELTDPNLRDQISSSCLKLFTEVAYKCLQNRSDCRPTMSDVVVSLEGALFSQNNSGEGLPCEQNEEDEGDEDESENDHMLVSVQTVDDFVAPLPTTIVQNKKKSKVLSKAFRWSLGIFTKKKKKDCDSSSRQSLGSDSTNDWLHRENLHLRIRRFKIAEILAATNNFSQDLKLGEGGFGFMYKGWIDHGTLEVAIKCTKRDDAFELLTYRDAIEAQLQLHHLHIMPLIGYCTGQGQLMLVYNYMVNRSLSDHLYGEGSRHGPLPWTKRLEICVGAAQGVQYLHHGIANKIIHRNIKPSNILLDENWVAKVSGFELSKEVVPDGSTATTRLAGTLGYLDPEYIHHLRLTEKSDVYAFGVVLLEVVSGRKSFDYSLEDKQIPLVDWFRICLWERKIDQLIEPYLIGRISPECLMHYLRIARFCVLEEGNKRPTMNAVVESLEIALLLQQSWYIGDEIDGSDWIPEMVGRAYNNVFLHQYGGSLDTPLDTYMQVNDPSRANLRLSTDVIDDSYIGLTIPLR